MFKQLYVTEVEELSGSPAHSVSHVQWRVLCLRVEAVSWPFCAPPAPQCPQQRFDSGRPRTRLPVI